MTQWAVCFIFLFVIFILLTFSLTLIGTFHSMYCILSSIMCIQVQCAPEFHNDFWQKLFLVQKTNFTRINPCKFIHHKSHLKPFLSYLPCKEGREYFSILFNLKKCELYLTKYNILKGVSLVPQANQHYVALFEIVSNFILMIAKISRS